MKKFPALTVILTLLLAVVSCAKREQPLPASRPLVLTVKVFKMDMMRLPTEEEGLTVLIEAPAGDASCWRGPYLKSSKEQLAHFEYRLSTKSADGFVVIEKSKR